MGRAVLCPVCQGSGKKGDKTCHGCGGKGWVEISTDYPKPEPPHPPHKKTVWWRQNA